MDERPVATALVVSDRASVAGPVGAALEERGYEVLGCPGPRPPGYVCTGGLGHRCALAAVADVIVLDTDLASDAAGMGTPSWHLLWFYRNLAKAVVVLAGAEDLPGPVGDGGVIVVPRQTDPSAVAAAADRLRREVLPAGNRAPEDAGPMDGFRRYVFGTRATVSDPAPEASWHHPERPAHPHDPEGGLR